MNAIKQISLLLLLLPVGLLAQTVSGTVFDKSLDDNNAMTGVNVHWAGSQIGTTTDANGKFTLFKPDYYSKLVISFVGYTSDTMIIEKPQSGMILYLTPGNTLKEVTISQQKREHISTG